MLTAAEAWAGRKACPEGLERMEGGRRKPPVGGSTDPPMDLDRPTAQSAGASGLESGVTWPGGEILAGGSPREVLRRLHESDPLGIEEICKERLAGLALFLDLERLVVRSMARTAFAAFRYRGETSLGEFLVSCVDRSIQELVGEDRLAAREGGSVAPESVRLYSFLADPLGARPETARLAAVVFNDLPESVRRCYFSVVLQGSSVAHCVSSGLGKREEVEGAVKRAILAISMLRDPESTDEEGAQGDGG